MELRWEELVACMGGCAHKVLVEKTEEIIPLEDWM
jgi:hypothetical protein